MFHRWVIMRMVRLNILFVVWLVNTYYYYILFGLMVIIPVLLGTFGWIFGTVNTTTTTTTKSPTNRQPTYGDERYVYSSNDCHTILPLLPEWLLHLDEKKEQKIYSQFGEDGITLYLTKHVPMTKNTDQQTTTNKNTRASDDLVYNYVEFGTEECTECNTRILREGYQADTDTWWHKQQWEGLLMDGSNTDESINLHQEMIHPNNIVSLLQKYKIYPTNDIGYLSEDTDYADYYIWDEIFKAGYRPRIVVSEINGNYMSIESGTVHRPLPNQTRFWAGDDYFGVSALALKRLWNKYGYMMVYCTKNQVNCFGVRDDLLVQQAGIDNSDLVHNKTKFKIVQECLWNGDISSSSSNHNNQISEVSETKRRPMAYQYRMHRCSRTNDELFVKVHANGELFSWNGTTTTSDTIEEFLPQFRTDCSQVGYID